MKNLYIGIIALMIFSACKHDTHTAKNEKSDLLGQHDLKLENHPGKKLMETLCYTCHNPNNAEKSMIAPPMIAVKRHYLGNDTSKEVFIDQISNFINEPSAENARMRGAVRKFGVMPYQEFDPSDIKKIASYIYDYQIQTPTWFKAHFESRYGSEKFVQKGKKELVSNNPLKSNTDIGMSYAMNTKKILGKHLMGKIQNEGVLEALSFCNEQAYSLTDSMSKVQNAQIKRVSDKPRNKHNQANTSELKIIADFKALIANKQKYEPVVITENDKVQFYYPIVTNSTCLKCHGQPVKDINIAVINRIKELYPEDKAMGYKTDEIRGVWSIQFDNLNKEKTD